MAGTLTLVDGRTWRGICSEIRGRHAGDGVNELGAHGDGIKRRSRRIDWVHVHVVDIQPAADWTVK